MSDIGFGIPQWFVIAVAIQRLVELILANRNTVKLLAEGATECGAGHYKFIVFLHSAWLVAIFVFIPSDAVVHWPLVIIFVVLQLGRIWVIGSLGPYWTTRIITPPNAPLVRRGPYRLFRHPNYLIVCGEIIVLPLAFGDWTLAVVFGIANLAVLSWRIRIENRALDSRREAVPNS